MCEGGNLFSAVCVVLYCCVAVCVCVGRSLLCVGGWIIAVVSPSFRVFVG